MKKLQELSGTVMRRYRTTSAVLANKNSPWYIQNFIAAFVAAFFAITALFIKSAPMSYTDLSYVTSINVLVFGASVLSLTVVLVLACFLFKPIRVLPAAVIVSATLFCACLQKGGDRNVWIGTGAALIVYLSAVWVFNRFDTPFGGLKIGDRFVKVAVGVMFAVFVGYMSLMGVCRYYSFTYDTFDFGIFAQMFGYMKTTGLPYTTVERGELLSHFAVHFSPFFYILLPGYMLFSTPAYLCVMQTLFVGLGVFAVYGIAKHIGFSPKQTLLVSALYLLYPAFSYGLHFDFHENKFLTFCILFTVYFMLKRKWVPFYIFGLLICTVKEDAAIYLIAIGLYMLLRERLIKHGIFTLALALAYFVFALKMIQVCGAKEGMEFGYRYSNFELDGEAGIGSIVKITLLDLGYTLTQIFQEEKIEFLLWMFLPVLFTPFMNKRISTLVLLAPMLLINLMSNWPYQYDIDFQYTYGTAALILVCTVLALRQLRPRKRNALLLAAVMLCGSLTVPRVIARNTGYINGYFNNREQFQSGLSLIRETLDKDSAIGVEGNVMPLMYDYKWLTLDPRSDEQAAAIEYYVSKAYDGDIHYMTDRGFELYAENSYIVIYKNPAYQGS